MRKEGMLMVVLLIAQATVSAENNPVCLVYFSGISCPHCAKTEPTLLGKLPVEYAGKLVIIKYEVYEHENNAQLMGEYRRGYGISRGVPQVVIGKNNFIVGDKPILDGIKGIINELSENGNPCPIIDAEKPFDELDLNKLPASPQIWVNNRVLVKDSPQEADSSRLKKLTYDSDTSALKTKERTLKISGGRIDFSNALTAGGWTVLWNDDETGEIKPHKIRGGWATYLWNNLIYAVLVAGLIFLAYTIYHDKKK